MAINRMYSVFDRKSLIWSPPISQPTDASAVRSLAEAVSDNNHPIGKHPSDYVLFFIGEFDDAKGLLSSVNPLVHVCDAIALVRVEQELPLVAAARGRAGAESTGNGVLKEAYDREVIS